MKEDPWQKKEDPPLFTDAFFKGYHTTSSDGGYKRHNGALKYFRESAEQLGNDYVQLDTESEVRAIKHAAKGMAFEIDWDNTEKWSWLEMVAQLTNESIDIVVKGPDNRSRGLIGCSVQSRPNTYDHKRHHALVAEKKQQNKKLAIWDFVLHREDGSAIRLHPNWSNTKVETIALESHADEVEPPVAGLGKSDGRGTYKKYKTLGASGQVKFDANKRFGDKTGQKTKPPLQQPGAASSSTAP